MAKEKKTLWTDWRFWVGVIVVIAVVGVIYSGGKKEEPSSDSDIETSTTQEDILEKGKEKLASIGSQVIIARKCAIMKAADVGDGSVGDNGHYNIDAFFDNCISEKNAPDNMDDESAYDYGQNYIERININWEERKNDIFKGKTLETYLLEWAAGSDK